MKIELRDFFVKSIWLIVKFSLGIAGYVIAGAGFILFVLGIGGNFLCTISGIGVMALGVYLFFNIDTSLTNFFNNDGKPD